ARHAINNATFLVSDWFSSLETQRQSERFTLIVSNPPYIAADDPHLGEGDVRFEPRSALVADAGGLADLRFLARSAREYLADDGWLLLEHGMQQGAAVRRALSDAGFVEVASRTDLGARERVSLGRRADHAPSSNPTLPRE